MQMKIVFTDGTSLRFEPKYVLQTTTNVLISPSRPPPGLPLIWSKPQTYGKLRNVRAELIAKDHYVMTSSGPKRVASVDP